MTCLIVALAVLMAIVAVQALRIHHLTGDRDHADNRADRQHERGDMWRDWGLLVYLRATAPSPAPSLADADDALRAKHRTCGTAVLYTHPADDRQVRRPLIPEPHTGDIAVTRDTQLEVAS